MPGGGAVAGTPPQARVEEPRPIDPHTDAYLGALAEHLARTHRLPIPTWALGEQRTLDRMWFPGVAPGFRATALRESPAAGSSSRLAR